MRFRPSAPLFSRLRHNRTSQRAVSAGTQQCRSLVTERGVSQKLHRSTSLSAGEKSWENQPLNNIIRHLHVSQSRALYEHPGSGIQERTGCGAEEEETTIVTMDARERFLFDLNGFLVVKNALSEEEVNNLNRAVSSHEGSACAREGAALKNAPSPSSLMGAQGPRVDLGGLLAWEDPGFRELLAHPKLVPYLNDLLGEGYRMELINSYEDHQPFVILQQAGSEGFSLHGGPLVAGVDYQGVKETGLFNPELQYRCVAGRPWNSLLAMSVQLCDTADGDGGFCVVRGSHKLNFPLRDDFANGEFGREHIYQPACQKGDIIFFSEATVHGALPWRARHQRRVALYRFAPPSVAYGRMYQQGFGAGVLEKCTPEQRVVLAGPFANRVERPYLVVEKETGNVKIEKFVRKAEKKAHDFAVFGTEYF